jgi:hypothetical protein
MKKTTVRLCGGGRTVDVRLRRDDLGYLHIHGRTMKWIRGHMGDCLIVVLRVGGKDCDGYVYEYSPEIDGFTSRIPGYVAIIL